MKNCNIILFKSFFVSIFLISILNSSCSNSQTADEICVKKVILDADVVDCYDDGFAMLLLQKNPQIDLLGVTTVSGNSWSVEGAASAIYQLQSVGDTTVPVFIGESCPFNDDGIYHIDQESLIGHKYVGALAREKPNSWNDYFMRKYGCQPMFTVQSKSAVDFIINTIHENPNEVTIVSIGPRTNIARAIQKDSTIVPLIKEVIYMGGAFFVPGNVTNSAEFNMWFDPKATDFVIRQPIKRQIFFGLDVCNTVQMNKQVYDSNYALLSNEKIKNLYKSTFLEKRFAQNPNMKTNIWDLLCAAYMADTSLLTSSKQCSVSIDTVFGPTYGACQINSDSVAGDFSKVTIVTEINQEKFWRILADLMREL